MKFENSKFVFPGTVKIKLTKIQEREDAEVANNIPTNDNRVGYIREDLLDPIVGLRYGLEHVVEINGKSVHPGNWFLTSEVIEILTKDTFKTLNSVYKIEIL